MTDDDTIMGFEFEVVLDDAEMVALVHRGIALLAARATTVAPPPESPGLFGRIVTDVLKGAIKPFGVMPPLVEEVYPRTLGFMRETFRVPVEWRGETRFIWCDGVVSVAHVGQCGSIDEYVSRYVNIARRAAPGGSDTPGPWTDWSCGMCPRTWPDDGSEPERCPDCGYFLVRVSLVPGA